MSSIVTQSWFVPTIIVVVLVVTLLPVVIILAKARRRSIRHPVRGTLTVAAASIPARGAVSANYSLTGVVTGPTIAPTPVQKSGIARSSKWPQPGSIFPVEYEDGNPTVFNILWDEVATSADRGAAAAAQLAQMMGSQPGPAQPYPNPAAPNSGFAGQGYAQQGYAQQGYAGQGFSGQPTQPYYPSVDISQYGSTGALGGEGAGIARALLRSGATGIGTVITVDARPAANGATDAKLGLQVLPENGQAAFVTTLSITFRAESAARRDAWCRPGAQIPVRYDPTNTNVVLPDLNGAGGS